MNNPESDAISAISLPKAELHVHLEGSIEPPTVVELAARHGVTLTIEEAAARYAPGDFAQFIESFIWVTSFLRGPEDYALIARRFAESMQRQNVLYAEVTLSIGVMFRRNQDPAENYAALRDAAAAGARGAPRCGFSTPCASGAPPPRWKSRELPWNCARRTSSPTESAAMNLASPRAIFAGFTNIVASQGMHRLIHAGEIGGPELVREAVEMLGAERIGHGIAVMRDERTMDFLAARGIPLEVCPTSNLRTGALARQLGRPTAGYDQHPLPSFFRRGLPVTLSSDDPAMFETTLSR